MKTLLQIITLAWRKSGGTGMPTKEFVATWRAANPAYGWAPLWAEFRSGSAMAVRGKSRIDRAQDRWRELGNTGPAPREFIAGYSDEYDAE